MSRCYKSLSCGILQKMSNYLTVVRNVLYAKLMRNGRNIHNNLLLKLCCITISIRSSLIKVYVAKVHRWVDWLGHFVIIVYNPLTIFLNMTYIMSHKYWRTHVADECTQFISASKIKFLLKTAPLKSVSYKLNEDILCSFIRDQSINQ